MAVSRGQQLHLQYLSASVMKERFLEGQENLLRLGKDVNILIKENWKAQARAEISSRSNPRHRGAQNKTRVNPEDAETLRVMEGIMPATPPYEQFCNRGFEFNCIKLI
ncbi:hypothetical protein K470DRAFT_85685 [Piedraia hortae CBS 480.64]|uniref:Uncharacterized protein n=1 Tax=Piedraia hortae CBS 480.64 TaxID=1314780 RepID=A0A6A7BXM9_9PEZI|nr:hypothetical protein K470DRAFT_85685 [Piedraia hortae CBS 480.64]